MATATKKKPVTTKKQTPIAKPKSAKKKERLNGEATLGMGPPTKANMAKQAASESLSQKTMGDMVPEQDPELEAAASEWHAAKAAAADAADRIKEARHDAASLMKSKGLEVYHCRTLAKKLVSNPELTVRLVKDVPDGEEG